MSNKITLNGQELFPARYFTAQDLAGKAYTVTIRAIQKEKMHNPTSNKDEEKNVIYFASPKRGTVLGKEFAESIALTLGEWDAGKWAGQKIVIAPTRVRNGKEGVRARSIAGNGAEKTAPPVADEDEDEDDETLVAERP